MENEASVGLAEDMDLLNSGESEEIVDSKPEKAPAKPTLIAPDPEEIEEEEGEEVEVKSSEKAEESEETADPAEFIHERPTVAQLSEAGVFKRFPSLRDVYFREKAFTEIFPSVSDAKLAAESSETLIGLQEKVTSGDAGELFKAIREVDEKSLENISGTILNSLYKISPDLHWKAAAPLLQNVVRGFYQEGIRSQNEDLQNAAQHLALFLFGEAEVAKGTKSVVQDKPTEKSEEQKKFEAERSQFQIDKFSSFSKALTSEAQEGLSKLVLERGAGNRLKIDPDGNFSQFIKDSISEKILKEVDKALTSDNAHMRYMNSLWSKAKRDGYSGEWKATITTAYLARAKSLVPAIRAKLVSEALGTSSAVNGHKTEAVEKLNGRKEKELSQGRTNRNGTEMKNYNAKQVDWSQTSDEDFLNDRVVMKKAN